MKTRHFLFGLASFVALLGTVGSLRADNTIRVGIVVGVTHEGRRAPQPADGRPVYYEPLALGYRQLGGVLTFYQQPPPPPEAVARDLGQALAGQGYRVAPANAGIAEVIVSRWGVVDPEIKPIMSDQDNAIDKIEPVNEDYMLALVVGQRWYDIYPSENPIARELLANLYHKDASRYFLIVSALDATAFRNHRQVLLWRAHVTTQYWGHSLDQVLGTMIRASAPYLGHETKMPVIVSAPVGPL